MVGHRPADEATSERIDDRQIQKPGPGRDVGDVSHPQPIGRFGDELTFDALRAALMWLTTRSRFCTR
jgi:hypothetical protein